MTKDDWKKSKFNDKISTKRRKKKKKWKAV